MRSAPAAHAARAAVLLVPAAEHVREPLAIALRRLGADGDAVYMAVALRETRFPLAHVLHFIAGQRRLVLRAVAKTCGTDRGAIAAAQTARRHLVPTRVMQVRDQRRVEVAARQAPRQLLGRMLHRRLGRGEQKRRRRRERQLRGARADALAAGLHEITLIELGEREVVTRVRTRPIARGDAETRSRR